MEREKEGKRVRVKISRKRWREKIGKERKIDMEKIERKRKKK